MKTILSDLLLANNQKKKCFWALRPRLMKKEVNYGLLELVRILISMEGRKCGQDEPENSERLVDDLERSNDIQMNIASLESLAACPVEYWTDMARKNSKKR
ncbi:hypothetical protein NDU88_010522 [Pleurodeles waltl]|uniref:Uncharacterized protein n=1 Tax=Pleurodeles waltl TaxID=8319 RepID=A0AAV7QY87_PLEWA|nr:hypothetical protein NDU88_010522 [Pleurodeles waltl]